MYGWIFGIFLAAMSLFTFCLYALDKRKAIEKKWRIPESALLGCSILGGAIGGCLAMKLVRHKTKHWYFRVMNFVFALAHIAILIWLVVAECY